MEFLSIPIDVWQDLGLALLILAAGFLVARLAVFVLDGISRRLASRGREGLDAMLLQALRMPLFWIVVLVAFQFALDQITFFPPDWQDRRDDLIFVLWALAIYFVAHKLVSSVMQWYGARLAEGTDARIGDAIVPFARRIILILLAVITLIVILSDLGVDVSAMVTTLGIGSLAIALAAQATLADTIAGMAIIADRPFSVGDRIEILELDTWGDVTEIGLRSTRIRTRDNRMVVVPNSVIGKSLVVNHSVPSTVYRVETHVGVAYGTDLEYARKVMIDVVRAQDWVMKDERIEALFIQYGDSAAIFRVRCWIEHYVETRRIMDKLNSCLYQALTQADISLPFPSQTIYHRVDAAGRDGLVAVLREADREQ
jgi:MscS family membrane protein